MTYAILSGSTIVSTGTARQLWPGVSFPRSGPNADYLTANGAVEVQDFRPHNTETEQLVRVEPYYEDGAVYRVEVQPLPPTVPEPDLLGFVEAVSGAAAWNNLLNTIAAAAPRVAQLFPVYLGRILAGDYAPFVRAWRRAVTAGYITQQQINGLKAVATNNNLPAEFIAALDNT